MILVLPMQTAAQPRGGHLSHKWGHSFSHMLSKLAEVRLGDNLRNQERELEWPQVGISKISLQRPITSKIRAQQLSK